MSRIFERLRETHLSGSYGMLDAQGVEMPDPLTRYFGGHNRQNHPYVSGYWQLIIDPPTAIFDSQAKQNATQWMHATAESFTPPSRNLNKADVRGQGGLGSSYVVGQTLNRTFSTSFREYQNLPLYNIIELWTSVIDPYTGVSPLAGNEWIPANYKGSALVVLTKPTHSKPGETFEPDDLEQVYFFHGIFPESPPYDTLNAEISTNDVAAHNITWSFDGWPLTRADAGVVDRAIAMLSDVTYYEHTYEKMRNDVSGGV